MNKGFKPPAILIRAFLASVSALSLSVLSTAIVAEETAESVEDDNKVTVTGTRIKKIDINNLSPILSISRADIDKQGYGSVKDVIDGLTQNSGGTIDNSFTFGFTPGASSVNLRGIGFGHTLVLIDGRRLPIYPVGIEGTSNFVDLSSIPVAFVERIDVLTDGASAVYGSDAVSGVINIITRKDIEGITLNYRYADTSDGGFGNHRVNLMTGARSGDTQIDLIVDLWDQKTLWANQRSYAASDIANPRGSHSGGGVSFYGLESETVYQHPDCGTANDPLGGEGVPDVAVNFFGAGESWCGFDRSRYRQLIAPQKRSSVMSRLKYQISSNLSLFGRVGYSNIQTDVELEPTLYGGALLDGFGTAVFNNGGILPAGAVNNPTTGTGQEEEGAFIRRLTEFGPRTGDITNDSVNFLVGLEGNIADGRYDWELGFSYNKTNLNILSNNIMLSALNARVDQGLDLFQPIPQATVDALAFTAVKDSFSLNRVVDFSITGDLDFEVGGGPVQFALAVESVTEEYEDKPDPRVQQEDAFDGSSSGAGVRDHLGLGGELSLPFSDNFEMDIAVRWDDYDDDSSVNSALSPRIAMGYSPTESILTRFSWGKSFRAPDMQRLFGDPGKSFVDIRDPLFQLDSNGAFCPSPETDPTCQPILVQSVPVYTWANINLKEEEGSNLNFGVIWEPNDEFSLSVDYFEIKMDEVVSAPSAQWIVEICAEFDVLCELVSRDPIGGLMGAEASVATVAINFAEQDTSGIDLVASYAWDNDWGRWSTTFNTTWIRSFETRVTPNSPKIERVGLGELPEYRSNWLLDYQNDQWGSTLRLNYIGEMAGIYCFNCQSDEYIDAWTTLSLNTYYSYSEYTKISFGINNLTNERPPEDPTQTTWPWFNHGGGYYSPVGREFYLQLDTHF